MLNTIQKSTVESLGYGFITGTQIPKGKDEYYLRNIQNRNGIIYRHLTAYEIEVLVRNRNTSDDWNKILVSDAFAPELVKNCKFYGLVRIGKLEPLCLTFSDLKTSVGLYNSTIISCDFGDNVVVDNVNYLSHYIIGSECILTNIHELVTTNHAKFGNGIIKEGEEEKIRIQLEICNENAGRSVLPFNGMLPGDAYLWSKYRGEYQLMQRFKYFTEQQFVSRRGFYGKIGERTVIKNCSIIKDVWIGNDAYIKGANKLKNLTINSGDEGLTQIGEGVELVNGIVGFGCKIFYAAKGVRFVMASHSQLKYGARLINSYLGNNATISCCEVLNSLIFPAHEQHHNNSFLCAATLYGQSNLAAGATIGSNHNSRSADGEIIAGRGFWPGLCVSLKHNCKFASFTILAKGDYPAELNISIPFSLVTQDITKDQLLVMPAYWFMYNMYALARNSWKYVDRDKRTERTQHIEYDYLAPDTINEIMDAIGLLEMSTGKAFYLNEKNNSATEADCTKKGKELLKSNNPIVNKLEITVSGFENTKRKTILMKVKEAYTTFNDLIHYYAGIQLLEYIQKGKFDSSENMISSLPAIDKRAEWINVGGQLIPTEKVERLKKNIVEHKIKSWDAVHAFYITEGKEYNNQKLKHALACVSELSNINIKKQGVSSIISLLKQAVITRSELVKGIYTSREKDYTNGFRKMVYDNETEMNNVIGKLEENQFILQQNAELTQFKKDINGWIRKLSKQ